MYDQVAVAEMVLMNTGRVGFEFIGLNMDPGMAVKPKPGVPVMIPHRVSHGSVLSSLVDMIRLN